MDKPEDLFHTKVLEAKFETKNCTNNWRSVLDTGLQLAFAKGLSIANLEDELVINFKEGIYTLQGFSPIAGVEYSWQNQDANKTAKNIVKLAKLLKCEIYVFFEWREKGKFPMKKGLLHWKP